MNSTATSNALSSKSSVRLLNGVGPAVAKKLEKLGIFTIQDILFHLPFRYEDRTRLVPIRQCRVGESAVIEGVIKATEFRKGKRSSLICYLEDHTGIISLRFFHFNFEQRRMLEQCGLRLRCFGEARFGKLGIEMIHPEYSKIDPNNPLPLEEHYSAVYSVTEGVSQKLIRKLVNQALLLLKDPDFLPDYLTQSSISLSLPTLWSALHYVHKPPVNEEMNVLISGDHPAQKRLALEELAAHQIFLHDAKKQTHGLKAIAFSHHQAIQDNFIKQLPFALTAAQHRVLREISDDLAQPFPMLRLLQGDVGSGKTIIAALAALQIVSQGCQVAVMAPTELLAEQHYRNFKRWLQSLSVEVGWLTGSLTQKEKKEILPQIESGKIKVVVGTHALFQEEVKFSELALIIVDEQHRFGVQQRLALRQKGKRGEYFPHQLIMTATPIPRTLAMTIYADLNCSVIDELPKGRAPIKTVVMDQQRRSAVIERMRENCKNGHQVYWVCTLIQESDVLQCQNAEKTYLLLQSHLSGIRIGLIHGRMKAEKKEKIMQAFYQGEIQILVATTVIEVGIDVPNANLIIIENAERLGLSQLHQLRGRVGRGETPSHCVLLYQSPLSTIAQHRLHIMRQFQDGFQIAEQDLLLRGPGEFLGTKQAGVENLKIANFLRDEKLLEDAHKLCKEILKQHPNVGKLLIQRWVNKNNHYTQV